jgi:hypothetical protein
METGTRVRTGIGTTGTVVRKLEYAPGCVVVQLDGMKDPGSWDGEEFTRPLEVPFRESELEVWAG